MWMRERSAPQGPEALLLRARYFSDLIYGNIFVKQISGKEFAAGI